MPAKISTKLLDWSLIHQAYEQIRSALADGHQAFIVCPLISTPDQPDKQNRTVEKNQQSGSGSEPRSESGSEPGSESDPDSDPEQMIDDLFEFADSGHVKAAELEVQFLQGKVFPDHRVGLLTSRLASSHKHQVMEDFRAGKIDILVSTTVIEVGVDVPNATVMIIEDADRFGLAQLHQLRGRVGRGQFDSQVFLVTRSRREPALQRLKLLERQSDGLKLAEQDLLMRQEGDITGVRQSGQAALKLINVVRDAELINQAHKDSREMLSNPEYLQDPSLQQLLYELQVTQRNRAQESSCV